MKPIYVMTDVEVDGPIPGENSMLSFASVAVDAKGAQVSEFQAVLGTLEDAKADGATIEWFKNQPEAHAAATDDPQPAYEVIMRYVDWVKGLPGDPVFTAHPLFMDGPWIDFYLQRFANIRLLKGPWEGDRLFYAGGLCLRSYAAGKLGWALWDCNPENYRPEWLGHSRHTHRAIDDARGYANLLTHLLD